MKNPPRSMGAKTRNMLPTGNYRELKTREYRVK